MPFDDKRVSLFKGLLRKPHNGRLNLSTTILDGISSLALPGALTSPCIRERIEVTYKPRAHGVSLTKEEDSLLLHHYCEIVLEIFLKMIDDDVDIDIDSISEYAQCYLNALFTVCSRFT